MSDLLKFDANDYANALTADLGSCSVLCPALQSRAEKIYAEAKARHPE